MAMSGGVGGMGGSGDFSVYVGDLDPNVTDTLLLETFQNKYKSVLSANVIVDPITKRSKKFGFVRFSSQEDSQRAIAEMNGTYILTRAIKLNVGFKKSSMQQPQMQSYGGQGQYQGYGQAPAPSYPPAYPSYNDPYGANKQNYGYGGYGSYQSDPYANNNQQYYNSYPSYPPPGASSGAPPYSGGAPEPSTYPPASGSGGYDSYNQNPYPSYGGSNNYGESTGQSYGASSAPAPAAQPSSSSYQYSNYYNQNSGYDYGTQPAAAASQPKPAVEVVPEAPVQAAKEVDYEMEEAHALYTDESTAEANEEYFEGLMREKGTVDMYF